MCLARAALKKVPVLCLDEATAAMDPQTEAHVLEIIERIFSERTTLTIAHRLDNVIRSDQVGGVGLVLVVPVLLLLHLNNTIGVEMPMLLVGTSLTMMDMPTNPCRSL